MYRVVLIAFAFGISAVAAQAQSLPPDSTEYRPDDGQQFEAARPQYVAARQSPLGGGFIEFLFNGLSQQPQTGVAGSPPEAEATPGTIEDIYAPSRQAALPPGYRPPAMDRKFLPTVVDYDGTEKPGTIIINTEERFLYLIQGDGTARR